MMNLVPMNFLPIIINMMQFDQRDSNVYGDLFDALDRVQKEVARLENQLTHNQEFKGPLEQVSQYRAELAEEADQQKAIHDNLRNQKEQFVIKTRELVPIYDQYNLQQFRICQHNWFENRVALLLSLGEQRFLLIAHFEEMQKTCEFLIPLNSPYELVLLERDHIFLAYQGTVHQYQLDWNILSEKKIVLTTNGTIRQMVAWKTFQAVRFVLTDDLKGLVSIIDLETMQQKHLLRCLPRNKIITQMALNSRTDPTELFLSATDGNSTIDLETMRYKANPQSEDVRPQAFQRTHQFNNHGYTVQSNLTMQIEQL